MLNSKALTKIQSIGLVAIIIAVVVGGGVAYVLWGRTASSKDDIKIGICADLDNTIGKGVWRAAVLAAEQVNAEGGVLGRNFTVVAEDDDSEATTIDLAKVSNALTKLLTVDKADYFLSTASPSAVLPVQDISADQKKICLALRATVDNASQRVLDDYERYKYFFKLWSPNATSAAAGSTDSTVELANLTGFTKIALLFGDNSANKQVMAMMKSSLPANGLEIVYSSLFPPTTTDFTSYLAAVEASGAQILVPSIASQAAYPFVKEWHDRESPFIVKGSLTLATDSNFWNSTEGKCEYITFSGVPALTGFPLTNKTVPTRDEYLQRWGTTIPSVPAVAAYDGVRFILTDAIKRAGTTETEAVVKALEKTDVETSMARHFVFTSSHDIFIGAAGPNRPEENYLLVAEFQFQTNGSMVLVYPEQLRKEAGATYQFPPWKGPWGDRQTP